MFTKETYNKGNAIAFSWHIDDVKSIQNSLTDEQAREILARFENNHNGSHEAMWEDLRLSVDWYKENKSE